MTTSKRFGDLERMSRSTDRRKRLGVLEEIQRGASRDPQFFELAYRLMGDEDSDVRWQACIAIGEWIGTTPNRVWEAVLAYARSPHEDVRDAVATVLLEHLLEQDFDGFAAKCRNEIRSSDDLFLDTLRRCWAFNEHARTQLDALIRAFSGEGERSTE